MVLNESPQFYLDFGPVAPILDQILDQLKKARAVQVIGHVRPDGDCIGSMVFMHLLLEQLGIPHAMGAEKMPVNGYGALTGFNLIRMEPDPNLNPDCIVFVDCATAGRAFEGWSPQGVMINIDHHGGNTLFGQINWVEPRCAATGEMLFYLARHCGLSLSPAMAEALLVAITTDTGSFRFTNTGPETHVVAADLIRAGASVDKVSRIAFSSRTLQGVQMTGHVLQNINLECGGALAWSELRQDVYERYGGENHAPENLADQLRMVKGVRVALLLHELAGGGLRANFRSDGTFNVAAMAARWGGGGHPAASGLTIADVDYLQQRDEILKQIMAALATAG